jgi:ribosomal protein S27AE
MYLDQLPSIRVTEFRRSGALTPDMTRTAVTLQGDDGTPVSSEVQVVRVQMRSGVFFLQFICRRCGRRAQVLRLHAGRIMCGRCTGLRYWCEGKPALRRAQHRIARLKATRFHGDPVSARPGRTMERRIQLEASLRRSEAVVRRHFAGRILSALQADRGSEVDASIPGI